jgi:hypothetical protein
VTLFLLHPTVFFQNWLGWSYYPHHSPLLATAVCIITIPSQLWPNHAEYSNSIEIIVTWPSRSFGKPTAPQRNKAHAIRPCLFHGNDAPIFGELLAPCSILSNIVTMVPLTAMIMVELVASLNTWPRIPLVARVVKHPAYSPEHS